MKKTLSISILVLGLAAAGPQLAQACGYFCDLVSFNPICFRCEPTSSGSIGCTQTSECSCFEYQCPLIEADAASPSFLEPEVQPAAACAETSVALVAN